MSVLRNSKQIREAVRYVLSDPNRRRVVMVAFVGKGAIGYLPNPAGIELVCWDKEGGTNPDAIRELQGHKVKVLFARSLHTKLYWAQGRGAVIGSANLSDNGLGDGRLVETAVRLPAEAVDIDALLAAVETEPASRERLLDLDRRTNRFRARNGRNDFLERKQPRTRRRSFGDWCREHNRKAWRLFAFAEGFDAEQEEELERLADENGWGRPEWFWAAKDAHTRPNEWLLMVDLAKPAESSKADSITWAIAEERVSTRGSKVLRRRDTPYVAVQKRTIAELGPPPFDARESAFQKAVRQLLRRHGVDGYRASLRFAPRGELNEEQLKELQDLYASFKPRSGAKA
ncbi:MAG: phospholipase D family protein [Burkholderiales bacterium]|nr:phospholipase D family protein [Burkholderiales bacterium]